jgi:hypothetical protein
VTDANAAIARFRAQLEVARPPTGGVPDEVIETEVAPVLPLLAELPIEDRAGEDFESFRFREALTVMTLLGRRLALLDLTPTAAVAVVEATLDATRAEGEPPTPSFDRYARVAVLEGFVRGREERVEASAASRASHRVRPLRIDDDVFALVVSGVHEPETLGEYVDALGRAMLDADASVGIVDLSQLGEPSRDRARAVFAADEVVRMLGARCIFSGVDARWTAAAHDAHVDLSLLEVSPAFAHALQASRAPATEEKGDQSSPWRALLERLKR